MTASTLENSASGLKRTYGKGKDMPFTSVGDEMHRFKEGKLHSGKGGPIVKKRSQAIAIALSEKRRAGKKSDADVQYDALMKRKGSK